MFALTIIDTASSMVELVQINNKSSENIARRFHKTWLARCPQPEHVINDYGGEFTGQEFQGLLYNLETRPFKTTTKRPQSNAIFKQIYQTVVMFLKTTFEASPPQSVDKVNNLVEDALATAMHSLQVTVSKTLKSMPGGLAYLATCY